MTEPSAAETELPVQKQLDAYNARDIDAFMAWWAEDCEYYEFPSQLVARGKAEIRDRHISRFTETNLFATLLTRMKVTNVVVDKEIVARTFGEGPGKIDVLAIYQVADNKITKAWFKMGAPRLYPLDSLPLRSATSQDVDAIRTLTRAAYADWVPVIGREPKPMSAGYAEAVKKHRIDLLHVDGKLVALIEMIPQNDHLLIENIAVSPAFQNRGLGRRLLTHAEQVTASLGCELVKLYTHKMFVKNIELYERLGYCVDREEAFWGGITVYMSKRVYREG